MSDRLAHNPQHLELGKRRGEARSARNQVALQGVQAAPINAIRRRGHKPSQQFASVKNLLALFCLT